MIPVIIPMYMPGERKYLSPRYSVFIVKNEEEAIEYISKAFDKMYNKPEGTLKFSFDKRGNLENVIKESDKGRSKVKKYEYITIDRFPSESVLKIKIFEKDMEPMGQSILLTQYLMEYASKK